MKKEVRIIAWDDCSFRFRSKKVLCIGAVYRGGEFLDGLLSVRIEKDGTNSTDKFSESIKKSRQFDQLSYIMLDGITFGGFNIVDIKKLHENTRLPVIAVLRKKPVMKNFISALENFPDYNKKRKLALKNAGKLFKYESKHSEIFYQKYSLGRKECEEILRITCVRSNVPEPLRTAHLIASGLSGESKGRA